MEQTITAIYENGILRPLAPLDLPEHTEVRISIQSQVSDDAVELRRRAEAALIAAGLMQPRPAPDPTLQPLSERERAELADRLAVPGAKPLSEIIIEEREGR